MKKTIWIFLLLALAVSCKKKHAPVHSLDSPDNRLIANQYVVDSVVFNGDLTFYQYAIDIVGTEKEKVFKEIVPPDSMTFTIERWLNQDLLLFLQTGFYSLNGIFLYDHTDGEVYEFDPVVGKQVYKAKTKPGKKIAYELADFKIVSMTIGERTYNSKSQNSEFVIGANYVGKLNLDMPVAEMKKIVGAENIKIDEFVDRNSNEYDRYFIFTQDSVVPGIIVTPDWYAESKNVADIFVRDTRFATEDGIKIGSTLADLRAKYSDLQSRTNIEGDPVVFSKSRQGMIFFLAPESVDVVSNADIFVEDLPDSTKIVGISVFAL